MTFTIEQLEALKEGVPVMHRDSWGAGATRAHSVKADNGMLRALVGYGPDGGAAYKDAERFAATPALLDQLITTEKELQRVRNGIEELRAECQNVVDEQGSGHEAYTGNEVAENIEVAHVNALTRILEGHNE